MEATDTAEEGGYGSESTTMKNAQEKKLKSMHVGADTFPLDRISNLPDDILVDILSTVEFRESAQTSVLSRRWLNLWTLVPRLHFDAKEDQRKHRYKEPRMQEMPVFVNWVNRILGLHKSSNLREFRIFFELDNSYQKEIDKWLEYAFGKGVESLELNFSRYGNEDSVSYSLTNELLERIAPKEVGFSRVRALCFWVVNISGKAIEFLLRKCPLLEDLRVIGSKALVNVVVSGPSLLLKHLQIIGCCQFESITISDTNIVSLRVSVKEKGNLLLNNLPMLTDLWIIGRFSNKIVLFSQFSCCLSQLTVLTLQTASPKYIMEIYKFPELHNLRRLVLSITYRVDRSMIGLTSLIDSCPRLEEFALKLYATEVYMWRNTEQKKATEQSLKGLKVFELYRYRGLYTYESELIMFFIENAVALEKIIIDPRETTWHGSEPPVETGRAKEYRRHAIEKFEGAVPKHVELVIL